MPVKKPVSKPIIEEKKTPSINRIIAEVNKKVGENVIGRLTAMPHVQMERISTGVEKLDIALGGGLPKRRVVELYGLPSGGKSLISMFTIREAQKMGLDCVYMDIEDSFDADFAKKLGVDTDKLILAQSSVGESTMDLLCKLLPAKPGVIVVDSVAAMITQAELDEESVGKAFMAPKARLMAKALQKITALNQDTLIIFINQMRATMAMYGPAMTTTGGTALPHYASIRVEIKKSELIHQDDKKTAEVIGQIIAFKVAKNKTAPPFKTGSFKFFYEDGHIE